MLEEAESVDALSGAADLVYNSPAEEVAGAQAWQELQQYVTLEGIEEKKSPIIVVEPDATRELAKEESLAQVEVVTLALPDQTGEKEG